MHQILILKALRILLGLALWLIAAGAGGWYLVGRGPDSAVQPSWVDAVWSFATNPRRLTDLELEQRWEIAVGDPIFADQGGSLRQIGEVTCVGTQPGPPSVQAVFYATAPPLSPRSTLTYHQTPDSLEWVLRTMLPAEKRKQIADELKLAFEQNREEVLRQLRPVVDAAIRDALTAVEQEVPKTLGRHRDDLERLAGKYQREILERQIVPLVRSEVWPIVRRHAEPMANEVGHEIWQRASLWRFGWRYAYDKSPLPQRDLAQQEWQRFFQQEASPVLRAHTEDFIRVQQQIVRDLAADPKVRAVVSGSLNRIAADPESQRIVWQIIRETTADNPRVRAVLENHWRSERMQAAIQRAAQPLEPTIERIGAMLFGTPQGGVTPEFARVLRNRILFKDRRWLMLAAQEAATSGPDMEPSSSLVMRVTRGRDDAPNPFVPEAMLPVRRNGP